MVSQTTYYGKLASPELDGGRKVSVVLGVARFKSSANVVTIGVPFGRTGPSKTSQVILGFSYGWRRPPAAKKGKHLQTSGVIHASAVTMVAIPSGFVGMVGPGQKMRGNIRVSRLTGAYSAASFWYKVVGW